MGNELLFGDVVFHFYNTPVHVDTCINFVVDKFLFTGDTLIKDEKTVTNLPIGLGEKLNETVQIIAELKGQGLKVMPGHKAKSLLDTYDLEKITRDRLNN